MDAAGGALWMGACGLALAALAVARAGRRQPQHRGWPWWAAALALAALALPAVAAGSEPMFRITVALEGDDAAAPAAEAMALGAGMRLQADVLLDRRRLIEWLFEPLLGLKGRV